MKRTHYCGELRKEHVGQRVHLNGWAHRRRDHGGVIFIDLRDREGVVQVVCDPRHGPEAHAVADQVRSEYVLAVEGEVRERPPGTVNPRIPTGEVEVAASRVEILNPSKHPPFPIEDDIEVDEAVRLKYRYLDLRRPKMFNILRLRHRVIQETRTYFDELGFLEVETPLLLKSTPEGARDFLVPSRLHPGRFYVLPQSPQLLKQTLMVAGIDRYFQIARCLRDEDPRADRQLEFTQIDVEMSFVEQDDVLTVIEGLIQRLFALVGVEVKPPFPRITYEEAMRRFGSDKPDTRFGMELVEVTDIVSDVDFRVFAETVRGGGQVKGIRVPGGATRLSQKRIEELVKFVQQFGAKGLAWIAVEEGGLRSSILRFLPEAVQQALCRRLEGQPGDLLLFIADRPEVVANALGRLRLHLGERLGLIDTSRHDFLWVVDFPLFEWDETEQRIAPMHHPFTSPKPEDIPLLDSDPLKVRANLYDLVLNGNEIGGGSIRIHRSDLQEKVFRIIGITPEQAWDRFGFLLEAFQYGAPPHGGIALGLDRIVALMAGYEAARIRDVIAFPKTQTGLCLLTGAPSKVEPKQLEEVHIRVVGEEEEA